MKRRLAGRCSGRYPYRQIRPDRDGYLFAFVKLLRDEYCGCLLEVKKKHVEWAGGGKAAHRARPARWRAWCCWRGWWAVSSAARSSVTAATIACMFNIGSGFGSVGPAENYAHLPARAKCMLTVCMIAGRLEFYTLIVILTPAFWKS